MLSASANAVASSSTAMQPPVLEDSEFAPLERAGKALSERHTRDDQWTAIGDRVGGAVTPTAYAPTRNNAWQPFEPIRSKSLPEELFAMDPNHSHLDMGLLPEIRRAWAIIDNRLLLWDWEESSSFSEYALPDTEVIVGVGLVRPRAGVFLDSIVHLLVITTLHQVMIVGVGFTTPTAGAKRELVFHQTGLSVPTDGILLNKIRGTPNGQIYLASNKVDEASADGCLYSLVYQSDPGWFGKQCTLSNLTSGGIGRSVMPSFFRSLSSVAAKDWVVGLEIDPERGLLYTLHRNSTIQMYSLPRSATDYSSPPTSLTSLSFSLALGAGKAIVALQVISVSEQGNARVNLVAITDSGHRVYYSHMSTSVLAAYQTRAPPSADPASSRGLAKKAVHGPGGFLALVAKALQEVEADVLLLTAPNVPTANNTGNGAALGLANSSLVENTTAIMVDGIVLALAEVTPPSTIPAEAGRIALNELATPWSQPRRQWAVLTNLATHLVGRQRPVDTLYAILEAGGMSGDITRDDAKAFYNEYGRNEFCSALLAIASSASVGVNIVEAAKTYLCEAGEGPASNNQNVFGREPQKSGPESVIFSGRHEALVYCFARVIRPIWKAKITRRAAPTPENPERQESNLSKEVLDSIGKELKRLRNFVENELHIFTLVGGPNGKDEAYEIEQASLANLQRLLVRSDEAISFILLLVDHNIGDIISTCPPKVQASLQTLPYQSLITTMDGRDVARALVRALINQQIKRQLSVDAISDNLQQKCGSFCSADDVLLYKAIQAMDRARTPVDDAEREASLRESLRLFIKAAKHISPDSLKKYCDDYNEMLYPTGAIDLALTCSREWDVPERALAYWLEGSPADDPRAPAYARRVECGNLVLEALESTDRILDIAAQTNPPAGSLSYAAADSLRSEAYSRALASRDEFFHHVLLYDWYIRLGRSDQLLQIRTPFLEFYLQREEMSANSINKWDLLWRYYVLTSRYPEAASILRDLADAPGLNLAQRVQYLSFAVGHAKAQYPSSGSDDMQQFVRDVENRLDVAQIQIEIHAVLEGSASLENRDELLKRLDEDLFSVSDLWNDFAQPLKLQEAMLLILHASDHRDPALVLQLWTEALSKAREDPIASNSQLRDVVSAKVTHLARRFHSSEIAFPLFEIVDLLENYSIENEAEMTVPGWVPLSLREGAVPWEDLLAAFAALSLKIDSPPWQEASGLVFLARDFATFVAAWLKAAKTSHSLYAGDTKLPAEAVRSQLKEYVDALSKRSRATPGLAAVEVQLNELVAAVASLRR